MVPKQPRSRIGKHGPPNWIEGKLRAARVGESEPGFTRRYPDAQPTLVVRLRGQALQIRTSSERNWNALAADSFWGSLSRNDFVEMSVRVKEIQAAVTAERVSRLSVLRVFRIVPEGHRFRPEPIHDTGKARRIDAKCNVQG